MIKLLKYDWKRNSNSIFAATVIFILAQTILTVVGEIKDWVPLTTYIVSIVLYVFAGFLAFLMVCQTYNANLKAYSRRLLPLPSLYTVASPILLLLASLAFLLVLFLLHEFAFVTWLGLDETILSPIREQLELKLLLSLLIGFVWLTVSATVFVFFCITFARTFEGKIGTWLGILMFIGLAAVLGWLDELVHSNSSSGNVPFGITGFSMADTPSGDGLTVTVTGIQGISIISFLIEIATCVTLLFGIRYMMNRKIKL
ncbi:hypothetical protein B1748_26895 [Paenibacillus sp. MY03]|uniref:hypothetical protein n=1 Tax=Paenibacillus sp. MY03 TaxID=302980 RepID=UPI000B3C0BB7|nr:hypothetical protein [Paenibacillus sp. MY03]OUS71355.1 hypothetical protein B1748_26895 [Paenibacillus sp. MY03]